MKKVDMSGISFAYGMIWGIIVTVIAQLIGLIIFVLMV